MFQGPAALGWDFIIPTVTATGATIVTPRVFETYE